MRQLSEPLKKLEIVSTCSWALQFVDADHMEELERDRLESTLVCFIPKSLLQLVSHEIAVSPSWRGVSICIEHAIVVVVAPRRTVPPLMPRNTVAVQTDSGFPSFALPFRVNTEGSPTLVADEDAGRLSSVCWPAVTFVSSSCRWRSSEACCHCRRHDRRVSMRRDVLALSLQS